MTHKTRRGKRGRQGKGSLERRRMRMMERQRMMMMERQRMMMMERPAMTTMAGIEQQLKLERINSRVLTEVQVIPEPVVEAGPVLYGRPTPAGQQLPPPPPVVHPPPVTHLPPVVQAPVVQQSHYQSLTPSAEPTQAVPQMSATLQQAGVGEEFIELNSSNAANFVAQCGEILLTAYPVHWHQIIINTPVLESKRKFVLLAINKQLAPMKLIPYFFRMENNRITFFVNLCGVALKTLCRRNLKVPYISDRFVEIEMTVKLFSKNFDLSEALQVIVSKRLDSEKKFLDLSYINSIPEVQEMLFDPTDNWHILDQLLRIAEMTAPELVALALAGNGIETLKSLWTMLAHSKWMYLRTLDLTDNEIQNTNAMALTRTLVITELYLDRNPICSNVSRSSYISAVRVTFPHLVKLDGTYLHTTARLPTWKPNFIIASAGDSGEFADQFIEHFFTLYDGADRMKLHGLYHENACFSLNCLSLDGQMTTPNARLTGYMAETRNLLRCSDLKKVRASLTRGSENILKRLSKLSKTQHDPYSFAVDLTVHTLKLTVLTVTGVFRDIAKQERSFRHFTRTFVLTVRGNGVYQITNDILYISNATTREAQEAFKFGRLPKKMKKYRPMPDLSESEKESMTGMVQRLTNMSAPWSRKCLEDTDWDLKEALEIFVELYETREIPKSAFSQLETVNSNLRRL